MGENQWPAISDGVGVWITHVDSYHCWGNHVLNPIEFKVVKAEPNCPDGTHCFCLPDYPKLLTIRLFPESKMCDRNFPGSVRIFEKDYSCNLYNSKIAYCPFNGAFSGKSYFLTTDPDIMMLWLEFNKQRYIKNFKNDIEMARDNLKDAKKNFSKVITDFRKSISDFRNARNEFHNAISDFKHHKG